MSDKVPSLNDPKYQDDTVKRMITCGQMAYIKDRIKLIQIENENLKKENEILKRKLDYREKA